MRSKPRRDRSRAGGRSYVFVPTLARLAIHGPSNGGKEVPRSAFAQTFYFPSASFMTVCRVHRNDAEARVTAVLKRQRDPACRKPIATVAMQRRRGARRKLSHADEATAPVDLVEAAADAIRMKIATAFKGHKLSTLIERFSKTQAIALWSPTRR